jgi:hypothetical protein
MNEKVEHNQLGDASEEGKDEPLHLLALHSSIHPSIAINLNAQRAPICRYHNHRQQVYQSRNESRQPEKAGTMLWKDEGRLQLRMPHK